MADCGAMSPPTPRRTDGRTMARDTPLRRYREVVCLGCAAVLWLVCWGVERSAYTGVRGHVALASLGFAEGVTLLVLCWREQTAGRGVRTPWITVAWATLPAWCALQLLVAAVLEGRG